MNPIEETRSRKISKNSNRLFVGIVVIVILGVSLSTICMINYIEEQTVKQKVIYMFDEIKNGYIEECNYNIPAELYSSLTEEWNTTLKTVFEYVIGGEEEWKRGWLSILRHMEYEVVSLKKQDGIFYIEVSIQNKDLVLILTETFPELLEEKESLLTGVLTSTVSDQLWDAFEKTRDETNTVVTGTYQIELFKNEQKEWVVQYSPQMIGTMAGIEKKYLKMVSDEQQQFVLEE